MTSAFISLFRSFTMISKKVQNLSDAITMKLLINDIFAFWIFFIHLPPLTKFLKLQNHHEVKRFKREPRTNWKKRKKLKQKNNNFWVTLTNLAHDKINQLYCAWNNCTVLNGGLSISSFQVDWSAWFEACSWIRNLWISWDSALCSHRPDAKSVLWK